MPLRPAFLALAACALLARTAAPALAGTSTLPLLPLELGNHWEYMGVGGTPNQEAITGTLTIRGREVTVKTYLSGPNAGLENWWLTGPNGEVLLAGFDNPTATLALAYEPPITICGGTPALGDSWTTNFIAYALPSMTPSAGLGITYGVLEDAPVTVPAGTFPCFGVGQIAPGGAAALMSSHGLTLDGRVASGALKPAANVATEWLSRGIGVVQFNSGDLFQLTGYGNPTPTRATTWGMLKRLYR